MTLVVGVNLGYYALFAGDDRETLLDPGVEEPRLESGMAKIKATPHGLATGSGLTVMVFPAIESLIENPEYLADEDETADFLRSFVGARVEALTPHITDERILPQLSTVGWILSRVNNGAISVVRHHTGTDCQTETMPRGIPASLLPLDLTAQTSLPAELRLKDRLRLCNAERDLDASLEKNMRTIAQYFAEQSRISSMLGSGIQIGYHTRDGEIELLDVTPLAELL